MRRARGALSSAGRGPAPHGDVVRERFEHEGLVRCARGLRFFCWFAIALLAFSAFNSYLEDADLFPVLLRIRAASVCLIAGVLFLLGTPLGRRRPRELALVFVLITALTFHALALAAPAQASVQYDRMNLVVLGLAVLITWSPAWSALGLRRHDRRLCRRGPLDLGQSDRSRIRCTSRPPLRHEPRDHRGHGDPGSPSLAGGGQPPGPGGRSRGEPGDPGPLPAPHRYGGQRDRRGVAGPPDPGVQSRGRVDLRRATRQTCWGRTTPSCFFPRSAGRSWRR